MNAAPVVYAVDDDPAVLRLMRSLLGVAGLEIETYNSGRVFLENFDPHRPGCLVLDLQLPEMTGLEVQQTLAEEGVNLPIIFLTAHGDVPTCAQAFKGGAFDFLEKPADGPHLMRSIRHALDADVARRQRTVIDTAAPTGSQGKGSLAKESSCEGPLSIGTSRNGKSAADAAIVVRGDLTPREREVMELIVAGKSLKQIAGELQVTIQTAAKHRARVWAKCCVSNDVELVRQVLESPTPITVDGPPF